MAGSDTKKSSSFLLLGILLSACSSSETPEPGISDATTSSAGDWVTLFAGDNVDQFNKVGSGDWKIIDDYVESADANHGFLVTRDSYGDFDLHVEFLADFGRQQRHILALRKFYRDRQ